jgi:L-asparaginase II
MSAHAEGLFSLLKQFLYRTLLLRNCSEGYPAGAVYVCVRALQGLAQWVEQGHMSQNMCFRNGTAINKITQSAHADRVAAHRFDNSRGSDLAKGINHDLKR